MAACASQRLGALFKPFAFSRESQPILGNFLCKFSHIPHNQWALRLNWVMDYLNPFVLAQIEPATSLDRETLRKSRALLLNLFELEGTTTVQLEGHDLDKNTILTLLDQLADPVLLGFHYRIATDEFLSQFLQGRIPEGPPRHLPGENDPFTQFVMPYWVSACARNLSIGLREDRLAPVEMVMGLISEMDGQSRDHALKPALRWLQIRMSRMDDLADISPQHTHAHEITALLQHSDTMIYFLNALPFTYHFWRYDFAHQAIALALAETLRKTMTWVALRDYMAFIFKAISLTEKEKDMLTEWVNHSYSMYSTFDTTDPILGKSRTTVSISSNPAKPRSSRNFVWFLVVLAGAIFIGVNLPNSHREPNDYTKYLPSPEYNIGVTIPDLDSLNRAKNPLQNDTSSFIKNSLSEMDTTGRSEKEKRDLMWKKMLEKGKELNLGKSIQQR